MDWDIVELIVTTIKSAQITATFTHVKGHQDDGGHPHESLSFLSQLNVDADGFAGHYPSSLGPNVPSSPYPPHVQLLWILLERPSTKILKSVIYDEAYCECENLMQCLILHNCWTADIPSLIDWKTYHLSTSAHPSRQTHFVKLCHDYLPASKLVSCYHPKYPSSCPLCQHPAEEHKHILCCSHPCAEW